MNDLHLRGIKGQMPALVGSSHAERWGRMSGGALDQTYKCLNKQLGRFFFL